MKTAAGALATTLTLAAGETKEIAFVLGMKYKDEADRIMKNYENPSQTCARELEELVTYWHEKLSHFQVKHPVRHLIP